MSESPKLWGEVLLFFLLLPGVSFAASGKSSGTPPVRILPVVDATDIRFTHVTSSEGQPHSRIANIVQDDTGFLWLTTQDGAQRFDGYHFREFRHDPNDPNSISGSDSLTLFKDHSGKLWISTDQGIDRFDPVTEKFTKFKSEPNSPVNFNGVIFDVNQSRDGTIWLISEYGLIRLNPDTGTAIEFHNRPGDPTSLSSDHVRGTFEERDGTFWVATTEGLDVLNRQTGKVTKHIPYPPDFPRPGTFNPYLWVSLCQDHQDVLWITLSYGYGLASLDRKHDRLQFYSLNGAGTDNDLQSGARAMYEDEDGTLWIGTTAGGLLKLGRDRTRFRRYRNDPGDPDSLSSDQINSLFEDRERNMWVGTTGGWVNRFSLRPLPFRRYKHAAGNPNSLDSNYASAVFQDSRGMIWVGSMRVLTEIDPRTGRYTFFRKAGGPGNLSSTWIISITEDRAGYLWFGTIGGGLNRYDPKSGKFKAFEHDPKDPQSLSHNTVLTLHVDHSGILWAGTEDGLDAFDVKTKTFRTYKPAISGNLRYRAITDDPAGGLWLGTLYTGVQHLDPSTGHFRVYMHSSEPGSLSDNQVNAVCVDRSGVLWVGTTTGLNRFDPATQRFQLYDVRDGLPNSNIALIVEDNGGELWLGTNNGLSRFDPRTHSVRNYSVSDGILGNEFYNYASSYKSSTGEIFLNNYAGVISFFPKDVVDNPYVPPVVLTDFQLFSKPVPIGGRSPLQESISFTKSLVLNHSQSIFSFEFAALSYANPDRNRYRYMLEGLETKWNETDASRRFVTYTTLPPGDYVFRVQGSNNRGVWNLAGAEVKIHILPPWWRTWWFRSASVGFIVAMAWFIYFVRVRDVKRRNIELVRLNQELQESESKLAEAQSIAHVGHWDYYADRGSVSWSEEVYHISGMKPAPDAIPVETLRQLVPPEDWPILEKTREEIAAGADQFELGFHLEQPGGRLRFVHVRGFVLRYSSGQLERAYGTVQDITERKEAEDEVQRLYREMEQRVIERTSQLASVNRELEAFTSSVSHDLRAPLRHIAAFSKILMNDYGSQIPDTAHDLLGRIEKGIVRMGRLIDDLLDLSRLTRQEMQFGPVNLDELVREVIEDLEPDYKDRNINWRVEHLPTVKGDPSLLRQVFHNLIANALKFTQRRPCAQIEIGEEQRNGTRAIYVRDNGVGFDMKYAGKLFGVFQRLHRADEFEGTGVGLVTVQRILQRHGGRIWAEAELDKGATFYFTCNNQG